jgi:serine/threonine protein kinase
MYNNYAKPPETIRSPSGSVYIINGQLLGKGAYSEVLLAREQRTGVLYALKRMLKSMIEAAYATQNIKQELIIHKGLSHPNIVRLIEFFEDELNVYLVMEYCQGGPLTSVRGPVNENLGFYYFYQLMLAINHMHQGGIAHRDIKVAIQLSLNLA